MTIWASSNISEGAFKETDDPIIFQGPKAKTREELKFHLDERRWRHLAGPVKA